MSSYPTRIRRLALSIADGPWDREALADRLARALRGGPPDPDRLAALLLARFDRPPHPTGLVGFLQGYGPLHAALKRVDDPNLPLILLDPPLMQAPPDPRISVPRLDTPRDLQDWLGLSERELAWFADRGGRQARVGEQRLHHYRYHWIEKPAGGWRLIEQPKTRLKAMQRQILRDILDPVPAHAAAHGFRRGRSCRSHAEPHCGQGLILRLDLVHYFSSVPTARIGALFRRLGYPARVAALLQGLCTHSLSPSLANPPAGALGWEHRQRLRTKHLPQGAPGSPALANLCTWRLDRRLDGLARHFGLNYTRYADDMAFSGPMSTRGRLGFVRNLVGAIALEEGFRVNHRKTRIATASQAQRLTGIMVNQRPNLDRREFDRLRAILYNCVRFGPDSQNREGLADFRAHLAGRVAHARWLNPDKAARLERLWKEIRWPGQP